MTTPASGAAERNLVTAPEPRQPSEDRETIGRELDEIRHNLGLSERALAERLSVDRQTLKRVFAGDSTVRQSKWKSIEKQIRALDAEMSSERQDEPKPEEPRRIEFRFPNLAGGVVVSGAVDDLDVLEAAVDRLIKRHLSDPPTSD